MLRLEQKTKWMRQAVVGALALAALVVPHFITAAPLDLLDTDTHRPDPAELPGANFPGSAFFFAQGAFDPVPGALTIQSPHVMGLAEVTAAPAGLFRGITALDGFRALNCLTSAIYYEAGNEPDDGQRAVAQVVLNRVRSPLWPQSVCGVVYQGSERTDFHCQFTFSCDGAMARVPNATAWMRARGVAQRALAGQVYAPVGLATHYHTLAVRPTWADKLQPVAVIGAHIFYRSLGTNGTLAGFTMPYPGRETISGPARRAWPVQPIAPVEMLAAVPARPYADPARPAPPTGNAPLAVPDPREALPESTIRPEYRNSGRPLT
ncbi:cell wall hydrolase [Sphingobium sp. AP49]|uniref:cell wall hydrolase n=1 Tax=Sphingobium sp. AP49 TaxID=1144307 RepID=UPI00026ED371|nr:cell wall hydrolase [Sphingobium sp. AP49]WHO38080.1 cell wall hydrolase [Sphingobium sp. AP49]